MITSPTTSIKLKSFPFKFIGRRTRRNKKYKNEKMKKKNADIDWLSVKFCWQKREIKKK